jgi:hypothetical protein
MRFTRREILPISGSAVVTGLSGCQVPLLSEPQRVDLTLYNYTTDPQEVKIEILRSDEESISNAEVFARNLQVPPPTGSDSAGRLQREDIVEDRAYILRALPKYGNGQWHHYHYYSGEYQGGENPSFDVRLYRDEQTNTVYVEFM